MSFLHPFPFLQLTQTLIFFMKLRQQSSAQVANRRAAHLHNSTGGLESNPPSELRETPKLDRDFQKTYHFEKKSKYAKKLNPELRIVWIFQKSKLFQKFQNFQNSAAGENFLGPFFENFAKNPK